MKLRNINSIIGRKLIAIGLVIVTMSSFGVSTYGENPKTQPIIQDINSKETPQYLQIKLPTTQTSKRGTKVTIKISDNIPKAETEYIDKLFKEIYPLIESFAGEPYKNQTLTIKYEEGVHTSLSRDLSYVTIGKLPDPTKKENHFFDSVMIVELFHSFLKGTEWGDFARPYEYYSWAIANLISEYSLANNLERKFTPAIGRFTSMEYGMRAYKDRRALGGDVFNGTESVRYYNNLFLDQVSNMFGIMLFTQSESRDNLDFYKRLNAALYKYTDQGKKNALELAMREVQKQQIEGMDLYEWFVSQPYKAYGNKSSEDYTFKLLPVEGELYFPKATQNYNRAYIILMKKGRDGNYYTRTPIEKADIEYKFYDEKGKLLEEGTKKIDMQGMKEQMSDYIPLPIHITKLSYFKLVAKTTINGKQLITEQVFNNAQ